METSFVGGGWHSVRRGIDEFQHPRPVVGRQLYTSSNRGIPTAGDPSIRPGERRARNSLAARCLHVPGPVHRVRRLLRMLPRPDVKHRTPLYILFSSFDIVP